jgi:glycosyltransferase involved in cell wall biosynthesis
MNKVPVSALVASRNEGHMLEDCLKSLDFCDEIYFIDIDSSDNSSEIAQKYAHVIVKHEFVNRIGKIHPIYIPKLKHDWVILIDPDERIRPELTNSIKEYIQNPIPFVSLIRAPFLYLFKGEKFKGGPYSKIIYGRQLFYRPGLNVTDQVHEGIFAKAGYGKTNLKIDGKNYNEHYWCNSWQQLKDKHNRYTQSEGKRLYLRGFRFSIFNLIVKTIAKFISSYIGGKYFKDGIKGLRVSLYDARYTGLSWLNLRRYQKELKSIGQLKPNQQVQIELIQEKIEELRVTTQAFIIDYQNAEEKLKALMLAQYQKSVHRLFNDALELNAFNEANNILEIASFNEEMKKYLLQNMCMERFKLIQESGSYKMAKQLSSVLSRR